MAYKGRMALTDMGRTWRWYSTTDLRHADLIVGKGKTMGRTFDCMLRVK